MQPNAATSNNQMLPAAKHAHCIGAAKELLLSLPSAAATAKARSIGGVSGPCPSDGKGKEEVGAGLQMQLLGTNSEVQVFAPQGMEQQSATGEELSLRAVREELLQAKALVEELRAQMRSKDAALQAKDSIIAASIAVIDAKDALLHSKDTLILQLQLESQRRLDMPAAAGTAHQARAHEAAGSTSSYFAALSIPPDAPATATPSSSSLGRYTAAGKHVRYKDYIYATAHVHDVDGRHVVQDGHAPVDIDFGFEVAPGDRNDRKVANAHEWGSCFLVFSDGTWAATALKISEDPSVKGKKWGSGGLKRDAAGRASARYVSDDVLLRKHA